MGGACAPRRKLGPGLHCNGPHVTFPLPPGRRKCHHPTPSPAPFRSPSFMPTIKICKYEFEISREWPAGHQLTQGEADALGQIFVENIRNNVDGWVAEALDGQGRLDELTYLALNDRIQEYAKGYQFKPRIRRVKPDSVLRRVATEAVRRQLGLSPDDQVPKTLVDQAEQRRDVRDEAERLEQVHRKVAMDALRDLF